MVQADSDKEETGARGGAGFLAYVLLDRWVAYP